MLRIGIPKEIHADERRVACTPSEVRAFAKLGAEVLVERDAGAGAGFADAAYAQAGAVVLDTPQKIWQRANLVGKIHPPAAHPTSGAHEADWLDPQTILVSLFYPSQNQTLLKRVAKRGATVLAMDMVPRISRAQKIDALSVMSNIAGYRAVLEASQHFGRFLGGQITAAGKVAPAKVLVIGAGVAGLSAIGTAVSLGGVVRGFDTRLEVQTQIESLNAEFLRLDFAEDGSGQGGYAKVMSQEFIRAEMALFAKQAQEVDIIITTALIPGKAAPKLLTAKMVAAMKPGSVIVDLAAVQGGNCELTEPGKVTWQHGVTIIGYTDLAARMAPQASELYAANLRHLVAELAPKSDEKSGEKSDPLTVNLEDPMLRAMTIAHRGKVTWPPPPPTPSPAPPKSPPVATPAQPEPRASRRRNWMSAIAAGLGGIGLLGLGAVAPPSFVAHFTVFVLACFVGWQVVWRVTPALHTPLMSVTNAISSIIIIGALLQTAIPQWRWLALLAVLLASINIAGGFWVTRRMLKMFQK